ncbi:ribonuclease HII [candidate division WOR-3 bacterium]|nr:ribonuclease HII [candidate division WOR-3 bacterium]
MIEDEEEWIAPDSILVCGVDEVGRGALAGPVAAGAVILPRGLVIPGVDDSKKLSPGKRLKVFPKILNSAITVGVGFVDSIMIDKWGIDYAVFEAMYRAILSLSVIPDWILVDGEPIPYLPISQTAIKGGDGLSHFIGAASIVAKVVRDRVMEFFDIFYPRYGFAEHKGYGTKAHIECIKMYGPTFIHRKSFRPLARQSR